MAACFVLVFGVTAELTAQSTSAARTHDAGQLRLTVTERGVFGSRPGSGDPGSELPSAEWPAGSGQEHLFEAGIWFGAVESRVARVTTSVGQRELWPIVGTVDGAVYDQHDPMVGGARYPDPGPDDDGDGFEDEDPANGLDDDGDGLVDEDGGAVGDQHFRVTLGDDDPAILEEAPTHDPLHVEMEIDTYQWSDPGYDDFVGFEITVRNVGSEILSQPRLGIFVHAAVGSREDPDRNQDDLPGFWRGTVRLADGSHVPVAVAYAYDVDADGGGAPGFFGVVMVTENEHIRTIQYPVSENLMVGFRWYDLNDPTALPQNDAERFEHLADDRILPSPAESDFRRQGDIAFLATRQSDRSLAPGWSTVLRGGFVAGEGLEELLEHAARAVRAGYGNWYDRDGNPATGVRGRESYVCAEDFGPPDSIYNPIYHFYADCVDSTDFLGSDPPQRIQPEDLDSNLCTYMDRDCKLQELRGFPECNHLDDLLPSEYFGCTGLGGREHNVPWMAPPGGPFQPPSGQIDAELVEGGVRVWGRVENVDMGQLVLRRLHAQGFPGHIWMPAEFNAPVEPGAIDLLDRDSGAGQRIYALEMRTAEGVERLDWTGIDSGPRRGRTDRLYASPLPANPRTQLHYRIDVSAHVRLEILDVRGRYIRTLVDEVRPAGEQSVVWNGTDDRGRTTGSGLYFARLRSPGIDVVTKLVVVR